MASFIVYGDASGQVTVAAPSVAGSNTITFPAETGTLITSAYTGPALPNQIAWNTTVRTSGFTAAIDSGNFCNTTSAAFTVTLPASPARGDFVVIIDYAGTFATNNLTVNGNGANISGAAFDVVIARNRSALTYTYIDATQGWLATSSVYYGSGVYLSTIMTLGGGGGSTGGTGGSFYGAGGAGGILRTSSNIALYAGNKYTIIVGAGGTGVITGTAVSGGTSSFTTATNATGGNGSVSSSRTGAANVDFSGGTGSGQGAGGGAGAGGNGTAGATTGGTGGAGASSSITGTPVTYGGGGGGGGPSGGAGGTGGGAPGTNGSTPPAATANLGGGGGGAGSVIGGAGGSGRVIVSVPTSSYPGITTGSPTVTTSGSNTILDYTTSGTYTA